MEIGRLFEGFECEAEDFFEGAILLKSGAARRLDEFNFSNNRLQARDVVNVIR